MSKQLVLRTVVVVALTYFSLLLAGEEGANLLG